MIRRLIFVAGLSLAPLAPASAATEEADAMTPLFAEACAAGSPTPEAIETRMNANGAWQRVTDTDLAIEEFATVSTRQPSGPFKRPGPYKQWRRVVDGKEVRLVLASFDRTFKHMCALLVPDVTNGLPYWTGFRRAMKSIGVGPKKTDVPHFVEYWGDLHDGRRAYGQIFSRSRVLGPGRNLHMFVAF